MHKIIHHVIIIHIITIKRIINRTKRTSLIIKIKMVSKLVENLLRVLLKKGLSINQCSIV